MLEFLAKSLTAIAGEVPTVNRHVSFGLNLFISGAAERYAKHVALSPMQGFVLVREMVEALGNSPDRVDAYCRQYADYKAEERYVLMIAAGNAVMSRYVEDDPDPFSDFADVIQMWTSDAAARSQVQGIVCIMFTDLVGSTQMTHERGDYGAQEVVRIHNAIVRSSLSAHRGREVKHTGDGIMASFASSADATRAGLEIQKALADHNARDGALQVNVRIGLNAGEAVEEEDDFFGTTVQVAARVCDKADTGEVFVTDNVRELAGSHQLQFEDAGQYEMKGVPQPLTLYRATVGAKVA
jgi:adenylate cyclase